MIEVASVSGGAASALPRGRGDMTAKRALADACSSSVPNVSRAQAGRLLPRRPSSTSSQRLPQWHHRHGGRRPGARLMSHGTSPPARVTHHPPHLGSPLARHRGRRSRRRGPAATQAPRAAPARVSAPRGVALLCARKRPPRSSVRAAPAPSPLGEAGAHTRPRARRRTVPRLPMERSRADAFPKVPSVRHRRPG